MNLGKLCFCRSDSKADNKMVNNWGFKVFILLLRILILEFAILLGMGTDSIEGLFLDMHVLGEDNCSMTSFGVNNAKRPRFEELSDKSLLADQGNSLKRHCFGSLVSLSLSNCNLSNDDLMKSLGSLSVLQDLNLSENPISSLLESVKGLNVLQSLSDCEKLVEVQGMFKLEPIGNAGAEMINNLGLVDLESMGSLGVELLNNMISTRKKGPGNALKICNFISTFILI
ncbi:hypothetical protein TEA_000427 [Camellia sinensis var. sinensis]|uniref:Uncharacterized protein n=1 Tax=Camellia sinensis var. sinensis TaxID=542762 RepID=A0A4S4E756_CAMSN|nr:hypothetical protein TEA_000427 [Camellia sinensis var. sinensis]